MSEKNKDMYCALSSIRWVQNTGFCFIAGAISFFISWMSSLPVKCSTTVCAVDQVIIIIIIYHHLSSFIQKIRITCRRFCHWLCRWSSSRPSYQVANVLRRLWGPISKWRKVKTLIKKSANLWGCQCPASPSLESLCVTTKLPLLDQDNKQARKPRSYASPKLRLTALLVKVVNGV